MEINEVIEKIIKFRDDRDWAQFHNPKDLAISLNIEVSELLELFQWKTNDEIKEFLESDKKSKVKEEIADIGNYLLLLCNAMNIDLLEAISEKIDLNNKKYPIEKSKGTAKKYNEL